MPVKHLKQEFSQRGLPTHGLKAALPSGSRRHQPAKEEFPRFTFSSKLWGRTRFDQEMPELGHGGEGTELVPRLVEALAWKEVIGTAAGARHTAIWTEVGLLITFGNGGPGRLGHGEEAGESVPKPVEALAGKTMTMIGASAGFSQTVVWAEAGELFSFGHGDFGRLGHGGQSRSLCRGWWRRWQGRRWLEHRLVSITQQCGPMRENSSPLGKETMGG